MSISYKITKDYVDDMKETFIRMNDNGKIYTQLLPKNKYIENDLENENEISNNAIFENSTFELSEKNQTDDSKLFKVNYKKKFLNKIDNWQIRVRIIKLKYLLGITENTLCYCTIKIGDHEFKTSIKSSNDLSFNEVFTHRINNIRTEELTNLIIKFSIYFRKSYLVGFAYDCLGSFMIDLGNIYRQESEHLKISKILTVVLEFH
jgi:hypothetical protein